MSLNLLKRSILFEKFNEINVYILHGLFKFPQLIKIFSLQIFFKSPLLRFPFLEKKLIDSLFVKQIKLHVLKNVDFLKQEIQTENNTVEIHGKIVFKI